jgi:hypothetical protein
MLSLIDKLLKFIKSSPENRTQFFLFLGFFVIPFVGLIVLYIVMYFFVLK